MARLTMVPRNQLTEIRCFCTIQMHLYLELEKKNLLTKIQLLHPESQYIKFIFSDLIPHYYVFLKAATEVSLAQTVRTDIMPLSKRLLYTRVPNTSKISFGEVSEEKLNCLCNAVGNK